MYDLLLLNATLVNEGRVFQADVGIRDQRIATIASDLSSAPATQVMDVRGLHLLPGMIDDQVHFREPGLTHKGDIATESAAAVAGGITTYMEMPNVNPLTINAQALEDKYQRATGRSRANFAFYLGASNDNLEDIKTLDPQAACGIKVFMGASTGNMLVDDPQVLDSIFEHAPIIIVTHCEDSPTIQRNEQAAREKYGEEVPFAEHPLIRSEEACWKSSSFAVELAKKHDARLHILHITTARELAHFQPGPMKGKRITGEACVHHLWFSQEDYPRLGAQIKCNPAVKRAEDRDAILQAVKDGRIDIVATDHAPHTWEEKQGTYFKAPAGLPLVQHALPSLLDHYHAGRLSLETIVEKVCHNPAEAFEVKDRGYLREGYFADLVLVDLQAETTVTRESLLYKCGWSPFEGHTFKSRIVTTLVNGGIAWHEGQLGQGIHGQRLTFNR
ncbi:dihydroorotase [Marinospirillum alkaliphilum]|uniref:Dihydroorotase n=1 Tax=Marinospirillum alkaliphilum DSM 21637 TaxID=1122209 RepID=A0A1K1XM96_9GAMM|nr:dihydroorotase [Marinospirillum alkaliphilum]SFX50818.1 dihydroorotase [Marinospirillum alkaliphilum DSM 21637]